MVGDIVGSKKINTLVVKAIVDDIKERGSALGILLEAEIEGQLTGIENIENVDDKRTKITDAFNAAFQHENIQAAVESILTRIADVK
jgi:hypothetical protein